MQNKLKVHSPFGFESSSSESSALRCDDILDGDILLKLIKGLISENLNLKSLLRSREQYQELTETQKPRQPNALTPNGGRIRYRPECHLVYSPQSEKEFDKVDPQIYRNRARKCEEPQHDFSRDPKSDTDGPRRFNFYEKYGNSKKF